MGQRRVAAQTKKQPTGENTGRWTKEEHQTFLDGLNLHGKEWKKIAGMISTRTVVQIRTHAQKYFQKLAKTREMQGQEIPSDLVSTASNPRPPPEAARAARARPQASMSAAPGSAAHAPAGPQQQQQQQQQQLDAADAAAKRQARATAAATATARSAALGPEAHALDTLDTGMDGTGAPRPMHAAGAHKRQLDGAGFDQGPSKAPRCGPLDVDTRAAAVTHFEALSATAAAAGRMPAAAKPAVHHDALTSTGSKFCMPLVSPRVGPVDGDDSDTNPLAPAAHEPRRLTISTAIINASFPHHSAAHQHHHAMAAADKDARARDDDEFKWLADRIPGASPTAVADFAFYPGFEAHDDDSTAADLFLTADFDDADAPSGPHMTATGFAKPATAAHQHRAGASYPTEHGDPSSSVGSQSVDSDAWLTASDTDDLHSVDTSSDCGDLEHQPNLADIGPFTNFVFADDPPLEGDALTLLS